MGKQIRFVNVRSVARRTSSNGDKKGSGRTVAKDEGKESGRKTGGSSG